nr:ribonuclease H-like domain-containing protein [Tanacetum cinerariifolium]
EMEKEDEEIIKSINETPTQKAVVQDEDDDVFVEATPLAQKVPVVDYQIVVIDNKPKYPLSRFTLEQLVNVARLQVEEESEMSLELLRFTRQQLLEYQQGSVKLILNKTYLLDLVPPSLRIGFLTLRRKICLRKLAQNSYALRDIHKHHAPMNHSKFPLHKVSAAAPSKSQPVLTAAARTISAVTPKFSKTCPNISPYAMSKSKSPLRRPFIRHPSPKPNISLPRVIAAKPSAGNPQQALKDKGVIHSGCSRHMTGNMSYLSDFEELNGGYVAFGGNPNGGKITGKCKIKTRKLDFDDVYFVKELKFNLFSVLQMCNKKNNVLFTNTKCLVLSSDFKLPDASQVLLRVPRENNMYNVNLKNIIPSGDLTCLFAKATLNESNLWHRRLGYVNFKTINKLVKGNLVRGLPSKVFTNENSCVACKKGK